LQKQWPNNGDNYGTINPDFNDRSDIDIRLHNYRMIMSKETELQQKLFEIFGEINKKLHHIDNFCADPYAVRELVTKAKYLMIEYSEIQIELINFKLADTKRQIDKNAEFGALVTS